MSRRIAAWVMAGALAAPGAVRAEGDEASCQKPCCQHERVVTKVLAGKGGCEGGGYMGIALREVAAEDLDKLKLAEQGAARVERVSPDSPAAKAGFKEGDVVVRFDGLPVASARQLARVVAEAAPGRQVKVEVRRGSEAMTLHVVVGMKECRDEMLHHLPDLSARLPEVTKDFREILEGPAGPRRLGIRYQQIDGQLARYFRVDSEHALLVTHVDEGSPAEKAGLKAGDVVLGIDGKDLSDAGDLRRRVASDDDGNVRLQVQRDGKPIEITVTLRSRPAVARPESTT